MGTWLLATSVTLAPIRLATNLNCALLSSDGRVGTHLDYSLFIMVDRGANRLLLNPARFVNSNQMNIKNSSTGGSPEAGQYSEVRLFFVDA